MILKKLYTDTDGLNWVGGSNWYHDGVDICQFHGVSCNDMNQVTAIELPGMGLKGPIPEELGFLEHLDVLDLSDNALEGFIPSDLSFAPLSSLNLAGNALKGIVPPKLCMKEANGNGVGGVYECDFILCAEGTYTDTGMANVNGPCLSCNDGAVYLGSKSCGTIKKSGWPLGGFYGSFSASSSQQPDTGSTASAIVIVILVVSAIGLIGFGYIYWQRRRERIQAIAKEEEISLADNSSLWFSRRVV